MDLRAWQDQRDQSRREPPPPAAAVLWVVAGASRSLVDRKSTRLNSSHLGISYGGFCGALVGASFPTRRSSDLGRIKGIDLAGTRLRRLPQCFGSLRELRVLWLQENELAALPESLAGGGLLWWGWV